MQHATNAGTLGKGAGLVSPCGRVNDGDHLSILQVRLSNERIRLSEAKTESERQSRRVWIAQMEKEIAGEQSFLAAGEPMSDAELLAQLLDDKPTNQPPQSLNPYLQ